MAPVPKYFSYRKIVLVIEDKQDVTLCRTEEFLQFLKILISLIWFCPAYLHFKNKLLALESDNFEREDSSQQNILKLAAMTSPLVPLPFFYDNDDMSNVVDAKDACGLIKVVMVNNVGVTTYIRLPISELAKHFDVLPDSAMSHRTTAAIFRDLKIFTHIQRFGDLYFDQDNGEGTDTAGFPK